MIGFICLFFPAVLAVYLYEMIMGNRLDRHTFWGMYCFDVIAINMFCFAVKRFVLGTASEVMLSLYTDMTPVAAMNYLIIAMVGVVAVSIFCVFAAGNIKISREVENETEKDKQQDR